MKDRMKPQKPATMGANEQALRVGYTNDLIPDPNPWDTLEGYSEPFKDGTPGFIPRNNYGDRL